MHKQANRTNRKKSEINKPAELILFFQGVIIQLVSFAFGALVALILDVNSESFLIIAFVTLAVGSFISGFAISRKKRSNGLLNGVIYSLPILIFPLISLFFNKFRFDFSLIINVFIILLFSALGGIVSVNIRKRTKIKK